MAHVTSVTLQGVSYHLPDGSSLFSDIDLHLDQRRTGLVGRNGVGKSILARIMAGDLLPSTGHCIRNGTVYYLTQQVSHDPNHTLAELAGVQPVISALE